jgi:hypothetical protein
MINSVRNTVLSVLNKNNYGYISPSDFNLYAKQAQMEIFEEYFSNYNKLISAQNVRAVGSDYADLTKAVEEVMEIFLVSKFLHPQTRYNYPLDINIPYNAYKIPSLTTTGDEAFMFVKLIYYGLPIKTGMGISAGPYNLLDPNPPNFTSLVKVGDIVFNLKTFQNSVITTVASTSIWTSENIFSDLEYEPYAVYRLQNYSELEKVTEGKISALNASGLTKPNTMFPAYTITDSIINTYPDVINGYGALNATYFRYPKDPKWTYISLLGGEPSFDQSQPDYQDFELPTEDEYKLAMKILQYCGISIREIQVAQFAIAQEQHEQPSFSQQQ